MSWAMCMIGVLTRQLYKRVRYPVFYLPSKVSASLSRPPPPPLPTPHTSFVSTTSPMDAAQNAKILRKEQLMSLPSLSCSLSTLPQARSLEQVQLHPSSMSAQLAAESEAKVRFALSLHTHRCLPHRPRHSSAKSFQNRALRPTHH